MMNLKMQHHLQRKAVSIVRLNYMVCAWYADAIKFLVMAGSEGENAEPHASDRKYTDGKTPIMWIITENNMWVNNNIMNLVTSD